jgi:periplasmic protein TonB
MDDPVVTTVYRFDPMAWAATSASALLHLAVVAALLPAAIPIPDNLQLTQRLFEVTLDLPSVPLETPSRAAAADRAARNVPPGSGALEQTASRQDVAQAAAAPTPVPKEPDVALILPSIEPPPPTEPNWARILPQVDAPSPITGRASGKTAPPAKPTALNLQEQAQSPPLQQPIRQARPKRASRQHEGRGLQGAAQDAPSPATRAALDYSDRHAQQDYLLQIIRRLSQQRFTDWSEASERGLVVVRLAIARDGRLLDVSLARSSGFPGLDRGVIEAIRKASPFAPLPDTLPADQSTFVIPINFMQER